MLQFLNPANFLRHLSPAQRLGFLLGPSLFVLVREFFHPEELSPEANAVLATTIWVASWWVLEVLPIAATALLPILLFPLTGGLAIKATTSAYGHPYIFLFVGGFLLAIAIEKWNLHRRIALNIIAGIGSRVSLIILGFMLATAFLSMWISNTATSVMMLPIGLAIIKQMQDNPLTKANEHEVFGKALMLAIAYSASIGGMATLIGTPPNLVLAGVVKELYGIELSFLKWMAIGLPISIVMLTICWLFLTRIAFKFPQPEFPGGKAEILRLKKELGPISHEETWVLLVFVLTALAWISRKYLLQPILPAIDDTLIAMIAGVSLFLISTKGAGGPLLVWEDARRIPWGIILLYGGGMALAEGFKTTGLAQWIGEQMTLLDGISLLLLVFILVAAVNFLTEVTSNLATTAMLLPILAPMALSLDTHPYLLLVAATLAASCAFMLPVATPPNAVVFGSGYLRIPDMVRSGVLLNLISILLITLVAYFLLPGIWGFAPDHFPTDWQGTP